ncbi:MAG: hypothetical protein AAF456_11990 [Planctomycetota bacterium]
MSTFRNYLFNSLAALALMVSSAGSAFCQAPPEPAIVVSIANVQEQLGDAKYLLDAAGMGQLEFFLRVQADSYLKGVNNDKPAGALFFFEETPEPKFLTFVPVDNLDDILNTISQNIGEVEEGDDYTTIISDSGEEIVVKQMGDYAYMSDNADMFSYIPEDPAAMLEDLPQRYNISAKVFGQRIPEDLRNQAIEIIREGYEDQLDQLAMSDDDELSAEIREQNFEVQMEAIKQFVHETDGLVLGMAANADTKSIYFDLEMTPLAGSAFAQSCEDAAGAGPTRFAGFVSEEAAFNMNMCFSVKPEDAEQYQSSMQGLIDQAITDMNEDGDFTAEQAKVAEQAIRDLVDVINETMAEGTMDGGMMVMADPGNVNFAMGMAAADPGKVEKTVKSIVAELEAELSPEEMVTNLDAGDLRGVTMHELIFTIPEGEEEARDMFGEEVKILVGIGEKAVYVAGGSDPMSLLAGALEESDNSASAGEMLPMQFNLYLEPIMRFAAGVEGEPMMDDMADTLADAGNDRVSITADINGDGMSMRFDIQDGLLKLIGVAAQNFGGGGGFGPADNDFVPVPTPVPNP